MSPGVALSSYVPDYVVRALLERPGESPVGSADRTDAAVVFADIVGFTPLSEALGRSGSYGTEELTRILNDWFGAMADCIVRAGGSVAQFLGDALTAVFCFGPGGRPSAAGRAVRCALEMQAAMARFQPVATRVGAFELSMTAGVAAGPLLLTIMGDPAIWLGPVLAGPALDLAVVGERQAGSGEVVVDGRLLVDAPDVEALGHRGRWSVAGGAGAPAPAAPGGAPPRTEPVDGEAARWLAAFLHPAVAERLASGRRDLVNEHRKVTVAFLGLPELVIDDRASVQRLRGRVERAVQAVHRYGGHPRQVATGDEGSVLVALFGTPVGHEDDEERAVHCILELLGPDGGRAGVTTGWVYCGEVGSDTRREYAVIGDSVNLAARLMHQARPGELLVDRQTSERVHDSTVQDVLEPLAVKGKSGRVEVWTVRALRDRPPARPAGPGPAHAQPLLGRRAELARIQPLLDGALAARGQVLALTGEAGIGKTRLAAEVVRAAERLGFGVYGGACRSHGTTTSHLVWRPIWRDLLELDTSLPIEAQEAQLVERIRRRDGGSGQRAPLLAPVVNLPMAESDLTAPLDPQTRDEFLRSLLLDCLRDRAAEGPLLLVLEDCHWIDPASDALLDFLARNVADQPVVLLSTARTAAAGASPPPAPARSALPHFTELRLAELTRADAEWLVALRLRQRYGKDVAVDPEVLRRIADRGEGNPFYLEELVSYLHARGVDPRDPRALAAVELPDGLHRLVMARIDALAEAEQATIKVASVIGRQFRASWIVQSYPAVGTLEEVTRHLERLGELDLTPVRAKGPEPEYEFRHAITQEAAYQSLTFQSRELLHERVGLFIEDRFGDRIAQYVDVLAHHYGRTQRVDKQRRWFRAAGDAAKAAFANEVAVDYYQRLLPLLGDDLTGEVLVELGAVWQLTGRWAEAEQAYRRAMEVAARTGAREVLAAGERNLGDLFMFTQSYAQAVSWLTRAADEFERLGDRQGLSRTLDRLTYAMYQRGTYQDALAAAQRHLALAAQAGDLAGMSIALNHTGLVRLDTGRTDEALELLRRALDRAAEAGDRRCLLHASNNLGLLYWRRGEHLDAVTWWHRALPVAWEIGDRQTAGIVIGNMGAVYLEHGDHARATKCFVLALRIALELGDWTSMADQLASVAATAAAQGRDQQAEQLYARAIALARLLDAPYFLCDWLHQQARLHAGQGRLEEAQRLNQEALRIADEHDERDIKVRAELLALPLEVGLGRLDARTALERLRARERDLTRPHERAALADALARLGPAGQADRPAAAPAAALPPLPAMVEDEVVDIDGVLRQVQQAFRQIDAA